MKKHYATIIGMTMLATAFIAASAGVAEDQNKDRTGAPGSDNACSQCHSAGAFDPQTLISVLEQGTNTPVTEYVAGQTYNVAFTVLSISPVQPSVYGFQATAVLSDGSNAGTFQNPGPGVQLEDVGGRHIIEHSDAAMLGVFIGEWVAPDSGSGQVDFYMSGVAANDSGSTAGDGYAGGTFSMTEASVGIEETEVSDLLVRANGGIIDITVHEQGQLSIFNLSGQLVEQTTLQPGQQRIDKSMPSGIYIFQWMGATGHAEQKVSL